MGDILSVEPGKIGLLAAILLVVAVLWVCSFNQLMLASVHPSLADSRGIRVFWQESVFSVAIAVVVTVSHDLGGPADDQFSSGAARGGGAESWPGTCGSIIFFSVVGALAAGVAGLLTSYQVGASPARALPSIWRSFLL